MTDETLDVLEEKYCSLKELAKLSKTPLDKVSEYFEMGILPYIVIGSPPTRYFHKAHLKERLREIKKLERQGKTPSQLQSKYVNDVREHRTYSRLLS